MYRGTNDWTSEWIGDSARYLLKAAVKRLPEFLQAYANELDERTEEYREVSETAVKMLETFKRE